MEGRRVGPPVDRPSDAAAPATITLEIFIDASMTVNTQPVALPDLQRRLAEIYVNRTDKTLFVKADPAVKYQNVIGAMDAASGAGVTVLGAILPRSEPTS